MVNGAWVYGPRKDATKYRNPNDWLHAAILHLVKEDMAVLTLANGLAEKKVAEQLLELAAPS